MKWMEKRQGNARTTLLCIPLCDGNKEALLESAENAMRHFGGCFDYVEWRLDLYDNWKSIDEVTDVVRQLSAILQDKGLIVTIRTVEEGGNVRCSKEEYGGHLTVLSAMDEVHYLDVQVFYGAEEQTKQWISDIHNAGTKVIGSYHDFEKTPKDSEIVERFVRMEHVGVDVAKMAVMPQSEADVLRFMQIVAGINQGKLQIPLVAMSMGQQGAISRLAGGITGSVLSFASLNEASAPGQIHIEQMASITDALEG